MNLITALRPFPLSTVEIVVSYLTEEREQYFNPQGEKVIAEILDQMDLSESAKKQVSALSAAEDPISHLNKNILPELTDAQALDYYNKITAYNVLFLPEFIKAHEFVYTYWIKLFIYGCQNGMVNATETVISSRELQESDIDFAVDLTFFTKRDEYSEGDYYCDEELSGYILKTHCDPKDLYSCFEKILKLRKLNKYQFASILKSDSSPRRIYSKLALKYGQVESFKPGEIANLAIKESGSDDLFEKALRVIEKPSQQALVKKDEKKSPSAPSNQRKMDQFKERLLANSKK